MMKKFSYQLLSLLFVLLLVAGCSDKEVNPNAPINAKIDGAAWNSKAVTANKVGTDKINISATNVGGIGITIQVKAAVGVYNFSTNTAADYFISVLVPPTSAFSSNACLSNPDGQINITEVDTQNKTISGTFRAKLCAAGISSTTKNVTEGVFTKIKYN